VSEEREQDNLLSCVGTRRPQRCASLNPPQADERRAPRGQARRQ
jgi:hypothetical protein